jgi:hypothetical protein
MGEEPVQLIVTPDRQKNMSWNYSELIIVFSSVSGQLKHLIAVYDQSKCRRKNQLHGFTSAVRYSRTAAKYTGAPPAILLPAFASFKNLDA